MTTKEKINDRYRRISILVGIFFIIGTVSGVLSGLVSGPILDGPDRLAQVAANANQIILSALLVLTMGFPLAMIPALLYPLFRKYDRVLAMGAIIFRGVLEAFCYIALAVVWLLLVTLSRRYVDGGMQDLAMYQTLDALIMQAGRWVEHMLAIVFSIGALMIYALFYRTRLIPRWLSIWGFAGGLLYIAAPLINVFDPQLPMLSVAAGVGVIMAPLALQEMVFAVWLIIKGFNSEAFAARSA